MATFPRRWDLADVGCQEYESAELLQAQLQEATACHDQTPNLHNECCKCLSPLRDEGGEEGAYAGADVLARLVVCDEEVIVGRDLLNRVISLLDGPERRIGMTWLARRRERRRRP